MSPAGCTFPFKYKSRTYYQCLVPQLKLMKIIMDTGENAYNS